MHALRELGIQTFRWGNGGIGGFTLDENVGLDTGAAKSIHEKIPFVKLSEARAGAKNGVNIHLWPSTQQGILVARNTLLVDLPAGVAFSVDVDEDKYFSLGGKRWKRIEERRRRLASLPTDGAVPYPATPSEMDFMDELKRAGRMKFDQSSEILSVNSPKQPEIPAYRFHDITMTEYLRPLSTLIIPLLYGISVDMYNPRSGSHPQLMLDQAREIADDLKRASEYMPLGTI